MIVNYNEKKIQIKIVYYGCALSGKTTSLKSLFSGYGRNDLLTSIETTTGRTLFFDFGTLQIKGGEWTVKISLYSATGQDFYASTRPATLSGADGIVFIIDSQKKYLSDNISSWNELNRYYQNSLNNMPLIVCLNKQDLPELLDTDVIIKNLNLNSYNKVEIIKTIASRAEDVLQAFKRMLAQIFPKITIKS
ncbi:hypothetical protein NEF87_002703 [Candidatus Lokiarchaeum ossiferum]|uniref:Small GTP-binding domain protein n=1 Tax=Candidatus Lokiarchaeum ossiferum TaxID=2951803 RepID=A0ABY6HSC9_9ARCH|nr:hypothetical protein NEF87_002703 [Candidatus Lokiarchaeum sp. B-35]